MGNSLRCCLACILPCGALDLIRIVHLNGNVEEITRPITAGEVLKDNPNHVLSKPCSQGMVRKILILSPESELKRGGIYFLIPSSSLPENKKIRSLKKSSSSKKINNSSSDHDSEKSGFRHCNRNISQHHNNQLELKEVKSQKKSFRRHERRRSSSSGVWKPHLDSIFEDL